MSGAARALRSKRTARLVLVAASASLGWLALAASPRAADAVQDAPGEAGEVGAAQGCLRCHAGLEDMHPEAELGCVDCHGGDESATTKLAAHVNPMRPEPGDERVAPLDDDLAYRRFVNPMDLRVVERTCAECHPGEVRRVHGSLHASTAGHLSDGYYEMGLSAKRGSRFGVFPVHSTMGEPAPPPGGVTELDQVPEFRDTLPQGELSTHFSDLVRKECMQCHLWSDGRAVRGRVGFDGDYRGSGCAACHVEYALDGLSESGDRSVSHTEPGHPRRHAMTRAPTTATCTSCHFGDASIGLSFRGLSQLPPGAPGGPDTPGTTDVLLNRAFYIDDATLTPPDVHHEKGMHCIDCHTENDVMGDGRLYGQMEHAVEISCADCHGSLPAEPGAGPAPAALATERGSKLAHLAREGDRVILTSKVDGARHAVPQLADFLNPEHRDYNARAAEAMTAEHRRLECYVCHNAWNVNFLGFHFDRNASLSQLDLLSGARTPGRVTTQEKVFATWKSFYAGWNSKGRIAPYLTGFSTMGTVRGADGELALDQVLPETAEGLSGLTMIHHQMHTNRQVGRTCIDCHRSSSTWGMGSVNFQLGRQLAFVADRRGIEVVALERAQLAASAPLAKLVLPDVVDLELLCDPVQGHAQYLFATEGYRGLHVIDVRDPTAPVRAGFDALVNPRGLALAGSYLYVADGIGGLVVYDVSDPAKLRRASRLPLFDAHAVRIQWPYAYVADGPGGLSVVDVRAPHAPVLAGALRLSDDPEGRDAAIDVEVLFQYSRPRAYAASGRPANRRSEARNLCALLDEERGLVLVDATEPAHMRVLYPAPREEGSQAQDTRARRRRERAYRGLALASHVDLAESQGGARTAERDYVYLLGEVALENGERRSQVQVLDVTHPEKPEPAGQIEAGYATEMLRLAAFYNAPFLQKILFVPGELGVRVVDASTSRDPKEIGVLAGLSSAYAIAVESFPLDRMIDADGERLKDVSHEGARWAWRAEIERILGVPGEALGTLAPQSARPAVPGGTARLFLARLDLDHTGMLEGEEYEAGGGAGVDADGDGRILLAELAGLAGLSGAGSPDAAAEPVFLRTRVDADGELARLLDGQNPYDFDEDGDRLLDEDELAMAFFSALDLDGDRRLTPAELSRQPGPARALRFGGQAAERLFRELDPNRDGKLSPREYRVRPEDRDALDIDRDGLVQLFVPDDPYWVKRGFVGPQSEWPARQPELSFLPPDATAERVLATFDKDGDGELSVRELKKRPDLQAELDRNGDDVVSAAELDARIAVLAENGVDATADGYAARWDLDGDGQVSQAEVPAGAALRVPARER